MAKLIEITGKALSGEWGTDDDTGEGIPVLRTTNFTNEGIVNYHNIALNQIFVAFNRDKIVIQAFETFRKDIQYKSEQSANEKLDSDFIALIKAMADNLNINYGFANDDLFMRPLSLKKPNNEE